MIQKTQYFIAYYGPHTFAWNEPRQCFVPYHQKYYRSYFDTFEEAAKVRDRVKEIAEEWKDDIYVDSALVYEEE